MPVDWSKDLVIRWDHPESTHVPLFRQAGIAAVLTSTVDPVFSAACSSAGIETIGLSDLQSLRLGEIGAAKPGAPIALAEGLWPGIRRPPSVDGRGDETASASREPWVDANGYWIGYLKALYPEQPAILGYLPEKLGDRAVPFDSLELALIEARIAGGNYVLALEPNYRTALLAKESKAMAAWEQLGRTARWMRENSALFRQASLPIVTALVETGPETAEIGNLLYRRNASPYLCSTARLSSPDPESRLALVAANLKAPSPELIQRILAHANAGETVIAAAPASRRWWPANTLKLTQAEKDRDVYAIGKGKLIAYRSAIADPSEFALDVIDIVTHKRRALRLWNAPAVIALAANSAQPGQRLLHLVNYGDPIDTDVQARIQGSFATATLLRPDGTPIKLVPAKRGSTTEVIVPELKRMAVVIFS